MLKSKNTNDREFGSVYILRLVTFPREVAILFVVVALKLRLIIGRTVLLSFLRSTLTSFYFHYPPPIFHAPFSEIALP